MSDTSPPASCTCSVTGICAACNARRQPAPPPADDLVERLLDEAPIEHGQSSCLTTAPRFDAMFAKDAHLQRALAQRDALAVAAAPFETFAAQAVDEHGWKDDFGRGRIFDWFGPEDFRALASARALAMGE